MGVWAKQACKPGSVPVHAQFTSQLSRDFLLHAIWWRPSVWATCYHEALAANPGAETGHLCPRLCRGVLLYSALLLVRFSHSDIRTSEPWALAPRFHPYPDLFFGHRGGIVSVPLSVFLTSNIKKPGCYPAPFPVEPGLSSPR